MTITGHRGKTLLEVFKRQAVDRVISSSGLPVGQVTRGLGLKETVLRR